MSGIPYQDQDVIYDDLELKELLKIFSILKSKFDKQTRIRMLKYLLARMEKEKEVQ